MEEARFAVEQGVDAIGLVFYPPSPRCVSIEQAKQIVDTLPAFVTAVGLFVNEQADEIESVIQQTGISLLQFHGNECPEYCVGFSRPYIKAIRMKQDIDLLAINEQYASAKSLLLDAYQPGVPGGTGETFDWERIPPQLAQRIILAGGLNAANIEQAINTVKPFAVDVSGGVEAQPGQKDFNKIREFMRGVGIAKT